MRPMVYVLVPRIESKEIEKDPVRIPRKMKTEIIVRKVRRA